jgi:hypothetical protein
MMKIKLKIILKFKILNFHKKLELMIKNYKYKKENFLQIFYNISMKIFLINILLILNI